MCRDLNVYRKVSRSLHGVCSRIFRLEYWGFPSKVSPILCVIDLSSHGGFRLYSETTKCLTVKRFTLSLVLNKGRIQSFGSRCRWSSTRGGMGVMSQNWFYDIIPYQDYNSFRINNMMKRWFSITKSEDTSLSSYHVQFCSTSACCSVL
jgi:hypothetical protein